MSAARAGAFHMRIAPFVFSAHLPRVVFGNGSLHHLAREIEALGARRAIVLSTPEQEAGARRVADLLGSRAAGVFPRAVMHVPIEIARAARDEAARLGADCAVAIGGGSTTGLGKAIALDSGLPILAIPTTYAGSEMTPIYGLTEGGVKRTGRDARVLPKVVIYDPELTLTLPPALAVTSGMNAIAHAAEGLYAPDVNPIMGLMAEEGIRALASGLPRLAAAAHGERGPAPREVTDAHGEALYGAWLCGAVLGHVAMGLHHKLCHTLGGTFNLPHAETHTVVLPHALAYNARSARDAMRRVARAIGGVGGAAIGGAGGAGTGPAEAVDDSGADAPRAVFELNRRLGAPASLREIGMPADGLDRAADLAVQTPYPNPRPLERGALRELLQRAYEGRAPEA